MTGLRRAVALFTVVPVGRLGALDRNGAAASMRWFPLVGAALGAIAGLPTVAVLHWASHAALVGAVLSVVLLVLVTRGLHLDGLADVADGLGSRAPADRALEIMRQSDIGPFGVLAVVLVLLIDVAALASYDGASVWWPVAALAVAAANGRLAALIAAHSSVPSARPDGFGAYVASSQPTVVVAIEAVLVLGLGAGLATAVYVSIAGWLVAQAAALVVAVAFLANVRRGIGGVTGDVFGALVEITTALTLAGLVLA
jgi:adenosylcobinamide-GDP ribazoletransferase